MQNTMLLYKKFGKGLLNLIYPNECQICKVSLGPFKEDCLCEICKSKIRLNLAPFCKKCGKSLLNSPLPNALCKDCANNEYYFDRAWAVGCYEGVLKDCIHLFKFKGKTRFAAFFAEMLLNFSKLYINLNEFDLIVPVPLHNTKKRERTFNQAELIAKELSVKLDIRMDSITLLKIRHTQPQTEFSKEERISNVDKAFKVLNPNAFKGKTVLLIDDVFTTGSTLNASSKAILEGGAKKVKCLVVARGA